ncbi:MAG: hypothetical protein FJW30_30315 [Acidobacteria bacterium]|nr:hypothetical protein [Acidobacteriota bacterium]
MNWSASRKLVVSAWVVVVLTVLVGGSGLWTANHLAVRLRTAVEENARQQLLAGQIATSSSRLEGAERALALATMLQQGPAAEQARAEVAVTAGDMTRYLKDFQDAGGDGAELASMRREFDGFLAEHSVVTGKLQAQKMDEALGQMNTSLFPKLAQMNRTARQLVEGQSRELSHLVSDAQSTRVSTVSVLAILCIISVIVGLGVLHLQRTITASLRRSISELTVNSQQLAGTAAQVSGSSQSVSQAASDQAASLEETSASAEQIHSMTRKNAEHAEAATACTKNANRMIQDANRALSQMVESMSEISSSSGRISKIIKPGFPFWVSRTPTVYTNASLPCRI